MRKIIGLIFLLVFVLFTESCRPVNGVPGDKVQSSGTPVISFNNLEYNFGKILEGEKVACIFKFENTGDGDLVINTATTSCGCTVPRFDDQPIKPGENGTIEVVFDSSHREGIQTKTITIRSNASVKVVVLRIVADVITANG